MYLSYETTVCKVCKDFKKLEKDKYITHFTSTEVAYAVLKTYICTILYLFLYFSAVTSYDVIHV